MLRGLLRHPLRRVARPGSQLGQGQIWSARLIRSAISVPSDTDLLSKKSRRQRKAPVPLHRASHILTRSTNSRRLRPPLRLCLSLAKGATTPSTLSGFSPSSKKLSLRKSCVQPEQITSTNASGRTTMPGSFRRCQGFDRARVRRRQSPRCGPQPHPRTPAQPKKMLSSTPTNRSRSSIWTRTVWRHSTQPGSKPTQLVIERTTDNCGPKHSAIWPQRLDTRRCVPGPNLLPLWSDA